MAKVIFVEKARKDILTSTGEQKLNDGATLDESDYIVKKGESYYWWKFRFGGKHISKTTPKRSQLTQSGFLSQLYDLEDRIADFSCDNKDDFDSFKDEICEEIDNMKDECQERLDAMPEHLQESSSSGETLRERIDNLESWRDEIYSIVCEYSEEELKEEIKECEESDEDSKTQLHEKIQEIIDGVIEELRNTSSNC